MDLMSVQVSGREKGDGFRGGKYSLASFFQIRDGIFRSNLSVGKCSERELSLPLERGVPK
jgi:hypothetical protein